MKDKFHGHYRPSEDEFKNLWQTCVFAFDASALLNLYSYSEEARLAFLKILADCRDRIWLPHRATDEYHNNRLSSISKEATPGSIIPSNPFSDKSFNAGSDSIVFICIAIWSVLNLSEVNLLAVHSLATPDTCATS